MFSRHQKVSVIVRDGERVVNTFTVDCGGELTFAVEPVLPVRSPLHPQALNLDDLKVGLKIQRCNIHSGPGGDIGIIIGDPFKPNSICVDGRSLTASLQVPVATVDFRGKLIDDSWFLGDMGVVPYGSGCDNQNYTLAVK